MHPIRYFAPPVLVDVAGVARDIIKTSTLLGLLARNSRQRNSRIGETVFVIANGPSLSDINLALLGPDTPCITCNYFGLHPLADSLNIVAHCIGDPVSKEFNKFLLDGLSSVSPDSYWVHCSASDFIPHEFKKKTFFYLPSVSGLSARIFDYSLAFAAPGYQSTFQMSISVALFMGFKTICLVGCDHDWLCCGNFSPHFYDLEPGVPSPNAGPSDFSRYSYSELIDISRTLFMHYRHLDKIASRQGAKIINASTKSYLDIFERRSYERCISEWADFACKA